MLRRITRLAGPIPLHPGAESHRHDGVEIEIALALDYRNRALNRIRVPLCLAHGLEDVAVATPGEQLALDTPGSVDDVGLPAGLVTRVRTATFAAKFRRNAAFKLLPCLVQFSAPIDLVFLLAGGGIIQDKFQLSDLIQLQSELDLWPWFCWNPRR